MTRELYQLLIRIKRNVETCNQFIESAFNFNKEDYPPRYFKNLGLIEFCDFLLDEEARNNYENIK